MKKLFLLLIAFLMMATPSFAGISSQLVQTVDLIYNANFPAAKAKINSYISTNPNDPAGYLMRGMATEWEQEVSKKGKGLNGAIMADYQKANALAQAAHDADPENVDKMILLGNTFMYVAKKQVDEGSKMKGGNTLKNSKELMTAAIEKNPEAYDAYFALGLFNYFSQNVPSGFKWLATLMGFKGDAVKGIEYIRKAAGNKNFTQGDAGFMLTYVYDKKKNFVQAIEANKQLIAKYPQNPIFIYQDGEFLTRQGKNAEARNAYQKFFSFCDAKPSGFCSDKYLFFAHYFTTDSYINERNYKEAKKSLEETYKYNDPSFKERNVRMNYWQGMIAKSEGDKEKAKEFFGKVQEKKGVDYEVWKLAEREMEGL